MNTTIKLLITSAALALATWNASASSNVFTATGPTEASTCSVAARSASRWVDQNMVQFNVNRQHPDIGDCNCRGNDKDGWACQVKVSY